MLLTRARRIRVDIEKEINFIHVLVRASNNVNNASTLSTQGRQLEAACMRVRGVSSVCSRCALSVLAGGWFEFGLRYQGTPRPSSFADFFLLKKKSKKSKNGLFS